MSVIIHGNRSSSLEHLFFPRLENLPTFLSLLIKMREPFAYATEVVSLVLCNNSRVDMIFILL